MKTRTHTHVKQRYAVKCLHYFVGRDSEPRLHGRATDPATSGYVSLGMTRQQAVAQKEKVREMILVAADNIRAGRE